ncbi:MAG: DUF3795 domain-containing protein [Bacteroidales bacterium]|nr:DUF3795 domain-containing protein [Bacteroidales bacterium]MBN2818083.1 DUF3795 domain-containing protein [Bacteroidales bacterium]
MKPDSNRRKFLKKGICAGLGCAMIGLTLKAGNTTFYNSLFDGEEKPDPKKLNYCGYSCPQDCQFLNASKKNDSQLKKEAYKTWHIKERYGLEFDADTMFCFGCKNDKEKEGAVVKLCPVRKCAQEKELDCCIECEELSKCEKELWEMFPDFHKAVIEMQKIHLS